MTLVTHEKIIDRWFSILPGGAGRSSHIFNCVEASLAAVNAPGVTWDIEDVAPGAWQSLLGNAWEFLVVKNSRMRDYRMFIGARDYGTSLSVSWYLVAEPRTLQSFMTTVFSDAGSGAAPSMHLFEEEELRCYVTSVHRCVKHAVNELMRHLHLDPTGIESKSQGILEVW